MPFEIAGASATATVIVNGAAVANAVIPIAPAAPGLFLLGQGTAAVVNRDGSVNSPSQPAAASSVISAYLTGLGQVSAAVPDGAAAPSNTLSGVTGRVLATVGGVGAAVQFAGLAPGFAGLYQVNIALPPGLSGRLPLQISAGGALSNAGFVSVSP